ncbi:hypothetical protein Acr_24g0017230 [Actinidia rufa]|uniref:Uncharacterized protein n=1 Tax=Actinidia rufa TaxID=165716 RepID=A0A7J0GXJ9_9ERIC|nr:hypothetical protein Acr_24g0017230 [Actinidia rufa]
MLMVLDWLVHVIHQLRGMPENFAADGRVVDSSNVANSIHERLGSQTLSQAMRQLSILIDDLARGWGLGCNALGHLISETEILRALVNSVMYFQVLVNSVPAGFFFKRRGRSRWFVRELSTAAGSSMVMSHLLLYVDVVMSGKFFLQAQGGFGWCRGEVSKKIGRVEATIHQIGNAYSDQELVQTIPISVAKRLENMGEEFKDLPAKKRYWRTAALHTKGSPGVNGALQRLLFPMEWGFGKGDINWKIRVGAIVSLCFIGVGLN